MATRTTLANEISDIFQMKRNVRQGLPYEILTAILKSMTAALQRGESIEIQGLGKFKVRTRKAQKKRLTYFFGKPTGYTVIGTIPEKKYVYFQPAEDLLRTLNGDSRPGN